MKKNHLIVKLSALFAAIIMVALVSCSKDTNSSYETLPTPTYMAHSLGCNLLPASEYAKIPQAKVPEVDIKATVLDLNVPPVGDQGGEGSCVAWGTTYAGRSTDWQSTHTAAWSQAVNIFSPEYVYNQIKAKKSCGSGSYVTTGLNLLKSQGVCTWSSMPYTDVDCSLLPTTAQKTEAANYKIAGYSTVAITPAAFKSFLATGKPIIVAGSVNSDFVNLASGAVLTTMKGRVLGGHCYCVVGYDDNKQAFKFMNSWGTSWATAGFGYISYTTMAKWWNEAYVIN
jgi:C1A family cysteine protease